MQNGMDKFVAFLIIFCREFCILSLFIELPIDLVYTMSIIYMYAREATGCVGFWRLSWSASI